MRSMDALIRLARFKIEELQKQISGLDEARASLEGQIAKLEASVPEEQIAANASKDGFIAYGSYAQAVIKRKQNLRASIAEVEVQVAHLRDALGSAFQELKKYELLEDRRLAQAAQKRAKKDQAALDEVAQLRRAG